ncbi:hypothetical protein DVU_0473 [Nitratidesulfovibrio vulgaris str. Hildenborough]|uniref:Uncharacterized protein n=1 Tax=Nitratidesulfovibrio vulgaris (strain ATCC 29579 / DSM 644 / CCUG 34227 / NCIMB 8303 / VKM B-1760 / Hildenborough) TaxID=882 RepID=Q72EU5_NITV2|nr:hypothetical protein DVU_0473 [Nitratidesulfovibrio vulgaris str. Hildenborough]
MNTISVHCSVVRYYISCQEYHIHGIWIILCHRTSSRRQPQSI